MKITGSEGRGSKRHLRFNPLSFLSNLKSTQVRSRVGSVRVAVTAESVSMACIQDHGGTSTLEHVEYKPFSGIVDRSEVGNDLVATHTVKSRLYRNDGTEHLHLAPGGTAKCRTL